ncbi:MAG: periplasmic heavy metal sensor [Myxococcales bacterium]|nr:periplasmic heavy metal sensor [Myxococcales bacterium]
MTTTIHRIALAAALCALAAPAFAQPAPPPRPPPGMDAGPDGHHPAFFQRMKQTRSQLLRKEAGLDEAGAARAETVVTRFDQDRQKLQRGVGEATRALRELVRADSKEDKAYRDGLDALVNAHRAMHDLRSRELDELRKVLTPKECAKVVIALERMHKHMRGEMRSAKREWLKEQLRRMDDGDDEDGPPVPPAPPGRGRQMPPAEGRPAR